MIYDKSSKIRADVLRVKENRMKKTGPLLLGILLILQPIGSVGMANINIDTSSPFIYPGYSKKISMNFQDADLANVLKIFSEQSNLNLVTAESVASKKITVYLDNVPVEQALEQILRANGLTYELQAESNIYIVKPLAKPQTEIITRVYPLKYATIDKAKMRKTLKIKIDDEQLEKESNSQGGGAEEGQGISGAVKALLTPQGKVVEDPRTNSLIVSDIASNFKNIELTIARLDVPVPQILIEVEMLEITKETSDTVGIKIGSTPLSFTGGERDHIYPWDQNDRLAKGYVFEEAEYRVGTIDASGLSATLQFLRTQSDTKNLARPKILTLNNEPAQIKIVTDEAIGLKVSTTSTSTTSSATTQEAERSETGVSLTVTPQANFVTDEITMAIIPTVTIARTGATFGSSTFRDPEERGTQSILKVKSGETIVIGGLMRDDTSKTVTKVPVLGDIPLVGAAFRHKSESIKERELIIFITPHIIKEPPPKSKTPEIAVKEITREQDLPLRRQENINQALSTLENEKM